MEWMKTYEEGLYKYESSKKEDLLEGIDSVIEEFDDYMWEATGYFQWKMDFGYTHGNRTISK